MIPVVIVESHQHVLEHVHDVLRKKKLFRDSWSMVHFDAHPDLACSKRAPAISFFNPRQYHQNKMDDDDNCKNLYELLDLTSSGIAEWILPLVLAAKLNQIEWIKPRFSSQMAPGNYEFAVGVETTSNESVTSYLDLPASAKVKVDFHHPYYLDDASVTSTDQLVLKQTLELQVSELPSNQKVKGGKSLWTLDICLDYFACQNPYIADLERRNALVTRAFLNVMESSCFNSNSSETNNVTNSLQYQTEILCFYKLLEQLLVDHVDDETNKLKLDVTSISSLEGISKYFETPDQARGLIRQLVIEIVKDDNGDALLSMVIEAIPNWSMPHDPSSAMIQKMDESLMLVEAHIQEHIQSRGSPFLVTIARSTLDGFCPPQVVETLQEKVLDILGKEISCGEDCGNTEEHALLIVHDYGEWEGSVIPWDGNT